MSPENPSTPSLLRIPDACYEHIRKIVYEHSRINLGTNKRELVQSRLAKRLRTLGLPSYESYLDFLDRNADELEQLINSISTNHTFFFREPQHFDFMERVALPRFVASHPKTPFRVWSSASSSGEEAYTIAIVLSEYFRQHGNHPWQIQCTDISSKILSSAQQAIYREDRLEKIPKDVLRRYFQRGENKWAGHYRVKQILREHVNFRLQNLLKPPYPFDFQFNIIFCRNVMIYFDRPTQEELVNHLARFLIPGGFLMIGHSESLTGVRHPYQNVQPAIYQKV